MLREAELLADESKKLAALEMKFQELKLIQEVDSTIVVSDAEYDLLRPEIGNAKVEVLPLVYDIPGTDIGYENRSGIVFIGGSHHPPNNDAVHFFVKEVMPLLRKKIPGIMLNLVGGDPPPDILALKSSDTVIHGRIDDLNTFLDTMRVSVAPMRFGAGMKGKVCSSIGSGLPTVLTAVAAEGIGLENNISAMITDEPDDIANAITKIYQNKNLWDSMSKHGIKVMENLNGPIASYQKLSNIFDRIQIPVRKSHPKTISLYKDSFI
jgi:glycosyltransferase involved in cell wall biosynthesis